MIEPIRSRNAQCCCGNVRVETAGEPKVVLMCHCAECQRRTGSLFGVSAYFDRNEVKTTGNSSQYKRQCDSGRSIKNYFCTNCGTTVHWVAEFNQDFVGVAAGCFTDAEFPAPTRSVFEKGKYHWVEIPSNVDSFEEAGSPF